MKQVDRCRRGDIPSVVQLHMNIYGDSGELPGELWVESPESYYRNVLFDNPYYDDEIPPLVFRGKGGEVEGLLGVMVRRMVFKRKSIRVAVLHSFMVDRKGRSSMAAIHLIRHCLSGPQDLTISDRANDPGRKVFEAMGGEVSCLYSMHWMFLLSPFQHFGKKLRRKQGFRYLESALLPANLLVDFFVRRLWRSQFQSQLDENSSVQEVDPRALLPSMNPYIRRISLHAEYTESDLLWLADFLQGNTYCGKPYGLEVLNKKGQRIGSCLYRFNENKEMGILFFWARKEFTQSVFHNVLNHALNLGAISVSGRMEPLLFENVTRYPCRIRHTFWVLFHSRDHEIRDSCQRGDTMLTEFDGEFIVTLG